MQRSPPDLKSIFVDFCEHFDGRLLWKRRGKGWTGPILEFFAGKAEEYGYRHQGEYMAIDQVWWSETGDIELALEHEGQIRDAGQLLKKEISHLIDLKALRKLLIAYVSEPDEKTLIDNVVARLQTHRLKVAYPSEEYMIIIGRPVRRSGKPVLLFRRHLFYNNGSQIAAPEDLVVRQAKILAKGYLVRSDLILS